MNETDQQLKKVKDKVIACRKCGLYKTRILPVIGQGNHRADIVFVGEAPGSNEDKTGIPFCGAAGNFLNELLKGAGIDRDDVYICNILKCRPPRNRDPLPNEVENCTNYLDAQLEIIKPKVLGAMGNYAVNFLMKKYNLANKIEGISKIHGQFFDTGIAFPTKLVALYHPAVAVYNANMKEILMNDFKKILEIL